MGDQHTHAAQPDKPAPVGDEKSAPRAKTPSRILYPPHGMSISGAGASDGPPLTPDNFFFLQRAIGNRAVGRLLQRKAKLSRPGDASEREADRVAEQVERMPAPPISRKAAPARQASALKIQRLGATQASEMRRAENEDEEKRKRREEEGTVQAKPVNGAGYIQEQTLSREDEERRKRSEEVVVQAKDDSGAAPAPKPEAESQIGSLRGGGGEPLADSVRAYYEPRFDQDFGDVRVHKGSQAAESARAVNARAYTTGSDIVFGDGEYEPETAEGRRLLAHELTHVVQQSSGRVGNGREEAQADGVDFEQGADAFAREPVNGETPHAAPTIRQQSDGSGMIQRSPLSDELAQMWMSGDKGLFFDRLRNLTVTDPDVHEFVYDNLNGDDLWLGLNLLQFGIEARWPIHLRVEREMKGWADSGGKGVAFQMLRAANGAEAGNASLTATISRIFAGDDLWLAQNLQAHGPEARWPIHLRVEREMKGWGDSGGKGVVFEMLRAANGAEAANADLTATISRIFNGDDLWLAQNLQAHGPEVKWPIHLRVEREVKGWGDSGGKGAAFNILRAANGGQAANADLTATINRIFAGDDLWLAQNLQAYGPEARWPIHLRVEREMKGWGDSGGKGAAFDILRAANGAAAADANLTATINRLFAGDDLYLAQNLQAYGPEASWPVPVGTYLVPFNRSPVSAPGEQIIFRSEFSYPLANNYHKLDYTGVGGTFDTNAGSATKTVDGLQSGNVYFFIGAAWTGATPVTVTLQVKCRSTNFVAYTDTWTFSKKVNYPTTMAQQETEGEVALGSTYSYKLGPDIGGDLVDDYLGYTILETFGQNTCNIALNELKPEFRAAHPDITTPAQITNYFFGGSGGNGTFTATAGDMIYDQHSGLGPVGAADIQAALITVKEIYTDLPQTYEAQPGVALGRYVIRRIVKTNGDLRLKKWKV